MTRLSVNVNKIAVLRNSRGGNEPDVCAAASACIAAGAAGITVHPRPDMRHIRPDDVVALQALIAGRVEFNIEGNAFAGARDGFPGFVQLVQRVRPTQCTLVPDSDKQITSDHGFALRRDAARLKPLVAELKHLGTRVSLFVDADATDIAYAAEIGADCVEIYTGPYAAAFAQGEPARALDDCVACAAQARSAGLAINAGHDLSQANLATLKHAIPDLAEVSIGHALIGEALYAGLDATVRAYRRILDV